MNGARSVLQKGSSVALTEAIPGQHRTGRARLDFWFPWLYLALTAALTLPILVPSYPPLVDYPNNLSRADILSRYAQVEQFRNIYAIQRAPIANLAIDLTVPPLARIIGIFPAGKLFLVLVLAVYAAGCYLLCRAADGRTCWVAMILACFFYNTAVTIGFMNYIAGVAVYLVTFACWLRWNRAWNVRRVLAFSLLALCCYFAHLSSIVMLGISVFAVCAWDVIVRRLPARSVGVSAIGFVAPAALFLGFMRGPGRIGTVGWNSISGKLQDLPLVVRTYSLGFDIALLAAALIGVLLWVRASSGVTAHVPTLVAGLALLFCFFLSPKDLFTSNAVDLRFVWPATILLAAALRPRLPSRAGAVCLAFLLLLWTFRTAAIWSSWQDLGTRTAAMVRVLQKLPRGANVYPVFFADPDPDTAKRDQALRHVVCYAVITRDAYVPTVSAIPSQQPIVQRGGLPYAAWTPGSAEPWRGYDYVFTYKPPGGLVAELHRQATLVGRSGASGLWRLQSSGRPSRSDLDALPAAPPKYRN